jgi:uncharacterized protein YprB with RNaseH-like and TPR domain
MATSSDRFSGLAALRPARLASSRPATLRPPHEEDALAPLLGAGITANRYGAHACVRNWFSAPAFAQASEITLELLSRTKDAVVSKRTRAALADPMKWLFLDTETTGLAGGTGTYAFLIGLAWWDAGGLQVEQLLMRDFGEEHSILHQLTAHLAERPVLVTFNGKAFDWPLLENRFTMTRSIPIPRLAAHLDLLHPARALWKLRLGSVRLIELERQVLDATRLGWYREEQIISAMIPQLYFDYLRGGPVAPLAAVVRHNQNDLRGLAALVAKIDTLLAAEDRCPSEFNGLDLFGLSRFLQRRGDTDRAHTACAQALDFGLPAEFKPQARRDLALFAKRRGDCRTAVALWQQLASEPTPDSRDSIHACEQLAIYYERRLKDFARAAEFARLALTKVGRIRVNSNDRYAMVQATRLEEKLQSRLRRLSQRAAAKARAQASLLANT